MKPAQANRSLSLLAAVLTFSACGLFLVSALLPFLKAPYISLIPESFSYVITYSSYKATIIYVIPSDIVRPFSGNVMSRTVFFIDYWFAPLQTAMGISWILVTLFFAQLSTLSVSLASFSVKRWEVQTIPVISSLSVTLLMVYVFVQVQNWTWGLLNYEFGYWLTYPSTILFLNALILRLAAR